MQWVYPRDAKAHSTHIRLTYNNQTVNDRVAHSSNPRKYAYHVTFDLDLDLEHTLDACWPGVHLVKVWWLSGHLRARRSDLRKSLQTDGQTDRRRTPRHCISSFLEWANNKTANITSTECYTKSRESSKSVFLINVPNLATELQSSEVMFKLFHGLTKTKKYLCWSTRLYLWHNFHWWPRVLV